MKPVREFPGRGTHPYLRRLFRRRRGGRLAGSGLTSGYRRTHSLPVCLMSSSPRRNRFMVRLYSPGTKALFFRDQGNAEEALTLVTLGATYYFDCCPSVEEIQARLDPCFEPERRTAPQDIPDDQVSGFRYRLKSASTELALPSSAPVLLVTPTGGVNVGGRQRSSATGGRPLS